MWIWNPLENWLLIRSIGFSGNLNRKKGAIVKKRHEVRYFLIHSMPRSASTSFRMMLNSTMGCLSHGEILGDRNLHGTSHKQEKHWTFEQRIENPRKFFRHYFAAHKGHAVGFKALSSHLLDKNNFSFLNAFFAKDPFVINLYRRNLVERFSSTKFHRMTSGFIKPEEILELEPMNVFKDCSDTVENWNSAIIGWDMQSNSINVDIQNITEDEMHVIEKKLKIWFNEPLGQENSKSKAKGQKKFSKAAAHLEVICADPMLDPFRNIEIAKDNLIYAMDQIVLPHNFISPYLNGKNDDLTKIDGINKILEVKLNQYKTRYYRQIAKWDDQRIKGISQRIGYPVNPEWVSQAKVLQDKESKT